MAAITLVDRSRTHIWKPLLHEIAAGSMDVDRHEVEYQAHGHWHGFKYRYGEMIGLDRAKKLVHLARTVDEDGREITPDRWLPYDTLVIAIGSVSNDFGVPGAKEHALMLDTPEQAERFNRRLLNACVRANTQPEPIRPEQLHVAIIGAGATGTELSAELHGTARGVVAFGLDKIDPEKDIKITLIEAADRIRAGAAAAHLGGDDRDPPEAQRRHSHQRARDGGDVGRRQAREWRLHAVRARRVGGGRERPRRAGAARRARGQPLQPARRQADARDDARSRCVRVGRLRLSRAAGRDAGHSAARPGGASGGLATSSSRSRRGSQAQPLKPFKYRDFGSLVSLGHYSTVGSLMGFVTGRKMLIEGFVAKLMYRSLYKMHETALHGYWKVALDTLSRLLTRRTEPHVKLH